MDRVSAAAFYKAAKQSPAKVISASVVGVTYKRIFTATWALSRQRLKH
jgi:hypothetical protein